MAHSFKHLRLITKHRHQVIKNAFHCGIFWHALKHDLSKYSRVEFRTSAKYYAGNHSPVDEERKANSLWSNVCQHHTKHNGHHWEYWTDFYCGKILAKTMPWKYATELICDMLAASKCYSPKTFGPSTALDYFLSRKNHYYMTSATKEYVEWGLTRYRDLGWKGLKKKDTKAKYAEITSRLPLIEVFEQLLVPSKLP